MIPTDLWLSGQVARFHTDPHLSRTGDTMAAHQWRVAQLVLIFWPDARANLLKAALTHGVGAYRTGDLPQTAADDWTDDHHRRMCQIFDANTAEIAGQDDFSLTDAEVEKLSFCRQLDNYLWGALHGRSNDFSAGFPELRFKVYDWAIAFDLVDKFLTLEEGICG